MPRISCIIPVYNGEDFLEEAINSILAQSFSDFEVLAICDGSTDRSLEILNDLASRDSRIKVHINKSNKGLPATLNIGLRLSQAEYIARMDQDDLSLPNRFEKQVRFLENNKDVSVVGSWWQYIPSGTIIAPPRSHGRIKIRALRCNPMGHPTVMFRRKEVTEKVGFYDETAYPIEDYEFWVRGLEKVKFANIPEVLLHYRVHPTQSSSQRGAQQQYLSTMLRIGLVSNVVRSSKVAERIVQIIEANRLSGLHERLLILLFFVSNLFKGKYSRIQLSRILLKGTEGI